MTTLSLSLIAPLIMMQAMADQALEATASTAIASATPDSALAEVTEDRLITCLSQAAADPAAALVTANGWIMENSSLDQSAARQCLGMAHVAQRQFLAAEASFARAAADSVREQGGHQARSADLLAQAGNAALADNRAADALRHFEEALQIPGLNDFSQGELRLDRARALVLAGRSDEARADLKLAHTLAPDDPLGWLLSATLARREERLEDAARDIEIAARLAPADADIALEAGVISALGGRMDAAAKSFESVMALAPDSKAAATARDYLAQIKAMEAP